MLKKQFVSSYIAGTGREVPEKIISNNYFVDKLHLDTSDEWITERTGIRERRWTDNNQGLSTLAEVAARKAIKAAGLEIADIDGIICATITGDFRTPSTACVVQHRLGMERGFAFDVEAACAGFVYALALGDQYIAHGGAKNILVIGGDIVTSITNLADRNTCVLLGDACGAVVLRAFEKDEDQAGNYKVADFKKTPGIYVSEMHSDGREEDILKVAYGSANRLSHEVLDSGCHFLKMDGKAVFKFAVNALVEVTKSICAKAGIDVSEIDHFISHQANLRILSLVAKQLELPESKIPTNISRYGNTSAASVPVLLSEEVEAGRVKKGDLVLFTAIGAGMAWGGVLVRM